MDPESPPLAERGLLTLSEDTWALTRAQAAIVGPLAAAGNVGHAAADAAAERLGISRRQVYVLVQRARQGSGNSPGRRPSRQWPKPNAAPR